MSEPHLSIVPDVAAAVPPLLRWAGGKRWFVKEWGQDMFDLVTRRGGRYIEPFLGGAAMALHLGVENMMLGDIEEELMLTYSTIRDRTEDLHTYLNMVAEMGTDEETYYQVRENEATTAIEKATKLIYLNRLCFNGVYRKNSSGEFNVPYGKKEKAMPSLDELKEVAHALRTAEFHVGSFGKLLARARRGDVIYADPPYHGTFSDYSAHGFSDVDHEHLAGHLKLARERGAEFFCHNSDTEYIRGLYEDWADIIPMEEKRSVNCKGQERSEVPCVLIVGVDDD